MAYAYDTSSNAGQPQSVQDVDWRSRLMTLISLFEEAEDATREARKLSERDIDYYDNKQWTAEEVKTLKSRGQGAITDNRIRQKIRFLQGLEQSQRTDPRALPRTQQHQDDAESATDALRYVCSSNRYNKTRSKAWKDILSAGWGGVDVCVERTEKQGANPRITVVQCAWDRMFWDPYSTTADFSDASYLGLVVWMDRDEAVRKYGDAAGGVFDETVQTSQIGGTFDDKPKITTWVSYNKRYRVRVVQIYYKDTDGVWQFCEFTKGGILSAMPSPWLDDDGDPEHPYAWRCANIDRDNNRYGEIRELVDLQDSINKKQSKFQHLVSTRQTFATEAALGSMTQIEMRKQLARPDGHVTLAPGIEFGKQFGVIPTGDMAEAQLGLLQLNIASMNVHGANAAMQGKDPRDQSGRAIIAQQQGGANEISPILDELREMDHECYRKIWRRIRQFWQAEEWIRVTDDERNLRWVGINQPTIDPATGQPMIDPSTGQPFVQHPIAELEVDIEIDDAPHMGTIQQEEFATLVDAAKAGLPIPPKTIIQASSFRNKGDILKAMREAEEGAAQRPTPEQAKAQAEQQKMEMQAQSERRKADMEAQTEVRQAGLQARAEQQKAELENKKLSEQIEAKRAMAIIDIQAKQREQSLELEQMRAKGRLELMIAASKGRADCDLLKQKAAASGDANGKVAEGNTEQDYDPEAEQWMTPAPAPPGYMPALVSALSRLSSRRTPLGATRTKDGMHLVFDDREHMDDLPEVGIDGDFTPALIAVLSRLASKKHPVGVKRTPNGMQLVYDDDDLAKQEMGGSGDPSSDLLGILERLISDKVPVGIKRTGDGMLIEYEGGQ